jgi:hypothetical protein
VWGYLKISRTTKPEKLRFTQNLSYLKIVGHGSGGGSWGHIRKTLFTRVFKGKIIKKKSPRSAAPEEFFTYKFFAQTQKLVLYNAMASRGKMGP